MVGTVLGVVGTAAFRPGPPMSARPAAADEAAALTLKAGSPTGPKPLAKQHLTYGGSPAVRSPPDWQRAALEYNASDARFTQARGLLYQLDAKSLRKLAADVTTWPPGRRTDRAVRDIFHRWAELDPAAALTSAENLPSPLSEAALFDAMRGFVETEPAQAAAYFAAPPSPDDRHYLHDLGWRRSMLNQALAGWSEQDGQAAVAFLGTLPANTLYPGPAYSLGAEWSRQDPAAALNWATRLPEGEPRSNALGGAISAWMDTDPQSAMNYALGLSADPAQDSLISTLADVWASRDLPGAARWVTAQSDAVQARAAASVINSWPSNDLIGAASWAGQLSGDARSKAYGALGSSWLNADPAAAQNWLNSLPIDTARDSAIENYLNDYQNNSTPEEKIAWAGKINEAQQRETTTVKILNEWLSSAPQAAHQWISQASLPASITNQLKGG